MTIGRAQKRRLLLATKIRALVTAAVVSASVGTPHVAAAAGGNAILACQAAARHKEVRFLRCVATCRHKSDSRVRPGFDGERCQSACAERYDASLRNLACISG